MRSYTEERPSRSVDCGNFRSQKNRVRVCISQKERVTANIAVTLKSPDKNLDASLGGPSD
jgi:hypothetical protein